MSPYSLIYFYFDLLSIKIQMVENYGELYMQKEKYYRNQNQNLV